MLISRRVEALSAVYNTQGESGIGELVVAKINKRTKKPCHYFAVVKSKDLILVPLSQEKNCVGSYVQRKFGYDDPVRVSDLEKIKTEKKKSRRGEPRKSSAFAQTTARPSTARAVDDALIVSEAVMNDDESIIEAREKKIGAIAWPEDRTLQIDLADIREIIVTSFAGTRRYFSNANNPLDIYAFADKNLDAQSERIRILFESRPSIEFITTQPNSRLATELTAAHYISITRSYLGLEASRVLTKNTAFRDEEARSLVQDLERTVWAKNIIFHELPRMLTHLRDFEDLVLIDLDLKRAFFNSNKLLCTFFDWLETLDQDLLRAITMDSSRPKDLQQKIAQRALLGLRILIAALHDARYIRERYTLLQLRGRALPALFHLLCTDHFSYRDVSEPSALASYLGMKPPSLSKPNQAHRKELEEFRNEKLHEPLIVPPKPKMNCIERDLTVNPARSALYLAAEREQAKRLERRRIRLGLPPTRQVSPSTLQKKNAPASAAREDDDVNSCCAHSVAGSTDSSTSSALFQAAKRIQEGHQQSATQAMPQTQSSNPTSFFVRDENVVAVYADAFQYRSQDTSVFAKIMDAQFVLIRLIDELTTFQAQDKAFQCSECHEDFLLLKQHGQLLVERIRDNDVDESGKLLRMIFERAAALVLILQDYETSHKDDVLEAPLALLSHATFLVRVLQSNHILCKIALFDAEMELHDLLQQPEFYTHLGSKPVLRLGRNYLQQATILALEAEHGDHQFICQEKFPESIIK